MIDLKELKILIPYFCYLAQGATPEEAKKSSGIAPERIENALCLLESLYDLKGDCWTEMANKIFITSRIVDFARIMEADIDLDDDIKITSKDIAKLKLDMHNSLKKGADD